MDTRELRGQIIAFVRDELTPLAGSMSTTSLLNLFAANHPGADSRKVSKILQDLAKTDLHQFATQGEPEHGMYSMVRRWRWHAPITDRERPEQPAPRQSQLDRIEAKLDALLNKLTGE